PWKGNYSSWLEQKKTRLQQEEKQESARQKALAHELEWVRQSPKARQAKGKARPKAYEAMLNQDQKKKESEIENYTAPVPRLGEGQDGFELGPNWVNSRAYAARFGFTGQDQQKKLGVLSGGERHRVHLARMLKSGANVLLLDEPTNDLDVNTIRALEEALENF